MAHTFKDQRRYEAKYEDWDSEGPWEPPVWRIRWGGLPTHYYSHRIRRVSKDAIRHGDWDTASRYTKRIKTGYYNR